MPVGAPLSAQSTKTPDTLKTHANCSPKAQAIAHPNHLYARRCALNTLSERTLSPRFVSFSPICIPVHLKRSLVSCSETGEAGTERNERRLFEDTMAFIFVSHSPIKIYILFLVQSYFWKFIFVRIAVQKFEKWATKSFSCLEMYSSCFMMFTVQLATSNLKCIRN